MTLNQAVAFRVKWKERTERTPCEHLNLKLEWTGSGSTGNYSCIAFRNRLPANTNNSVQD
jgi:hypothetical protein